MLLECHTVKKTSRAVNSKKKLKATVSRSSTIIA